MKKKFLSCLLVLIMVISLVPQGLFTIGVHAATNGDFTYTVSDNKATITDFNQSYSGALTIPSTLDGYPVIAIGSSAFRHCSGLTSVTIPDSVTSIGSDAFYYCSGLTSITIPDSVTSIGSDAFAHCSGLTSVTIPDSVTSIGSSAFFYCSGLTSITIPDSVTSIGTWAFAYCSGLTSVTIPDSVTSIGSYAFGSCSGLTSITIPDSVTSIGSEAFTSCSALTAITVDENNAKYSSLDGVLFNKDKTTLIQYPAGKTDTPYVIPDSVTSIGSHAFAACSGLTSVTIPDSVTSIGSSAFAACSGLTSITIPDSVTSIGSHAFANCSSLTSVTIPDSVTSIGYDAFAHCSGLTSITIPDSVTSIGTQAFYCCSSLTSVTIPDSVISIGSEAFYRCSALTAITVDENNANYSSLDGVLFNKDKTTLIQYPAGKSNTTYVIPDSVIAIGSYAFYYCSSLTSITIPDSVTSIGSYAFASCRGLTSVTIPDSVTSIGSSAFESCSSLTSVTIPDSVTSIGSFAFDYCSSLTSVTIPDSVTSIEPSAFRGCSNLRSVGYTGSETDRNHITIGYNNSSLTNATWYYNCCGDGLHVYTDGCDEACNACQFPRVGEHSYDHSLDQYCNLCGHGRTFAEFPIVSISAEPMTILEGSNGWNYPEPNGDTWYQYSVSPDRYTITMADGLTFSGQQYEIYNLVGEYPQTSTDQSYTNPWGVGDHVVTIRCGNITGQFVVTIEKSPVVSVTVAPIRILENTNGYYTWDSYWDSALQESIRTPEYYKYYAYPGWFRENFTITLKDGRVIHDAGFSWNDRWYNINYSYNQNYENQWTVGNVYEVEADIAGYNFTYPVEICSLSGNESYEYMESATGIIITDSYIDSETLRIPDQINDKPVVAVAGLGGYDTVKHLIFPDSVQTLGDMVLEGFENLETITFGSGIGNLRSYMFDYAHNLRKITVSEDNVNYCVIDDVLYNKDVTTVIAYPVCKGNVYEIPDTVTDFSALSSSVYGNLDVTFSQNHPDYVTVDGVTYNKEMTKVIFCAKSKAGSYTMPDTVTEINHAAFVNCKKLTEVIVSDQVTDIVYYAFASCENLANIELPSGLTGIDFAAFRDTYALKSIELPETLEYIGESAFNASGITSIKIPDSVERIGDSAFYGSDLETLDLGNGITSIEYDAFSYTPLTGVVLPDSLTYLGGRAFKECQQLKTLSIGSGLTYIAWEAFKGTGLESVTIPGNIETIETEAFSNSAIRQLTLEEGLRYIADCAFENCNNLTGVAFPQSTEYISVTAFFGCASLVELSVAEGNPIYHSSGNCVINTVYKSLFMGCGGSVIPTDGSVEQIGDRAFYDRDNLESIVIPGTITSIGYGAFTDCDQLAEIIIPDSVVEIGGSAFMHCDSLTRVELGDGVDVLGSGVFAWCPLTSLDLGNNITYISPTSFENCNLTTLFIPDSVTDIMYSAFYECSQLTSIELPLSVQSIEFNAFYNCESLTDVYYEGTEEDRANMQISETGNDYLLNATWHYGWNKAEWNDQTGEDECEHIYSGDCDDECNKCGSNRIPAKHTYTAGCDDTCDVCGAVRTAIEHTYDNACDADCNVCGDTRVPADHVYDNACDADCNVCGAVRTPADHVYDNACDADCNVCGNTRTPSDHVHDNACDAVCNVCGDIRTPADHVYDNACDASCNVCGDERIPSDHVYDNNCDDDCNVCGDVRVPSEHIYDDRFDGDCNECGEEREVLPRPVFAVDSAKAKAGDSFTVDISTKNNCGIVSFVVDIEYDAALLELVSVETKDFANIVTSPEGRIPLILNWADATNPNNTTNGVIATLTFRVKDDAPVTSTNITLTYDPDDVFDYDETNVPFGIENGTVEIIEYLPGDINGDGNVNNKDLSALQRYFAGWPVEVILPACDTNGDGKMNNKDLSNLQRYLAGWPVEVK